MKFLIVTIILGLSLYGGEMDRIEAIVLDIENLRQDYNKCKKELDTKKIKHSVAKIDLKSNSKEELKEKDKVIKEYKDLLSKEKLKNTLLSARIELLNEENSNKMINDEKNEKSNNKYIKLLITKEKENKVLKDNYNKEMKIKDNMIKSLESRINSTALNKPVKTETCEDDNPFPKLIMKDDLKKITDQDEEEVEKEKSFKASPFRLNRDSDIYDSINGTVIYKWEDRRSFTSSLMTQNWIKITGYFIDKEWRKADEELWIEKKYTIKR